MGARQGEGAGRNEVRAEDVGKKGTIGAEKVPHLIRVATVVDFAAYVPGGNWVTVGFDPPWSIL